MSQSFRDPGAQPDIGLLAISCTAGASYQRDRWGSGLAGTFCGPAQNARRDSSTSSDAGYALPDCGVRPNRINNWMNGADGVKPMGFHRINRIYDEYGKQINVYYSAIDPACRNSNGGAGFDNEGFWTDNRGRCFPGRFGNRWIEFNKFVVDRVVEIDPNNPTTPSVTTTYDYRDPGEDGTNPAGNGPGGMGWVRTTGLPIVPNAGPDGQDVDLNTFRDYRGYQQVTVTVGAKSGPNDATPEIVTRHRFMRGMDGHPNVAAINIADDTRVVDENHHAGFEYDTTTLNADGNTFSKTSRKVELRDYGNAPDPGGRSIGRTLTVAEFNRYERTAPEYSATRYEYDAAFNLTRTIELGRTDSNYDNISGPTTTGGPTNAPDDCCTINTYSGENYVFIDGLLATTTMVAGANCTGAELSKTEMRYDNTGVASLNATRGQLTLDRRYVGDNFTSVHPIANYVQDRFAYEDSQWRRLQESTDARDTSTTYAYQSFEFQEPALAGNGNTARVIVTEPGASGQTFTTETRFDTFGRVVSTKDYDGRVTRMCHDRLDRLVDVYLPDNFSNICPDNDAPSAPAAGDGSMHFQYLVELRDNEGIPFTSRPTWTVVSSELWAKQGDGYTTTSGTDYIDSINLLDGFGRTMETATQSPGEFGFPPTAGYVVARTLYDDAGRTSRTSEGQFVAGTQPPTFDRTLNDNTDVERDHRSIYDEVNREIRSDLLHDNTIVRQWTTQYPGGYTTRSLTANLYEQAPEHGWTQSTTDAYGNLVRVDEQVLEGADYTTFHGYNMRFDQTTMRDPLGKVTSMTYNNVGWTTSVDEPDHGFSLARYYRTGEVYRTTDANEQVITTQIDSRGRVVKQVTGEDVNDNSMLLAAYSYDPAGRKGAAKTTRSFQPVGVEVYRRSAVNGAFDKMGRPTQWSIRMYNSEDPAVPGDNNFDDNYTFTASYTRSGEPYEMGYPAMGGLAGEKVTNTYSSLGHPASTIGDDTYLGVNVPDSLGRPGIMLNGAEGDDQLQTIFQYRENDGRLSQHRVTVNAGTSNAEVVSNRYLSYDEPGNIVEDRNAREDSVNRERRCHRYDSRQRLIGSFTTQADTVVFGDFPAPCDDPPRPPSGAGPAPYDLEYGYDAGDRFTLNANRTLNVYDAMSPASGCRARTNATKPHAYRRIGAGNGQPDTSFGYDCNGAMTSRTEVGGDRWRYRYDERQRLIETRRNGGTPSVNVYDDAGQRTLRVDPNGDRTVYFGISELRYTAATQTVSAARFYPHGAIRTFDNGASSVTYTATDQQGSIIH